jgi:hypothetical protein
METTFKRLIIGQREEVAILKERAMGVREIVAEVGAIHLRSTGGQKAERQSDPKWIFSGTQKRE